MARTQDFTPFTPELLGAAQDPQTPCRTVTNDPLSVLRTHHFGLATPLKTVLQTTTLTIYGIEIDSIAVESSTPLDKLQKLRLLSVATSQRKKV